MNKETITKVLQEILSENPNYFLPPQFHILSWKSQKIAGALITKINGQRYIGFLRKDRNGQEYWKYKPLTESLTPLETNNDNDQAKQQSANQQSN